MGLQTNYKSQMFFEDLMELASLAVIGAIAAWGTKIACTEFASAESWFAKGSFVCLAGGLGFATVLLGIAVAILSFEMFKEYVIHSKE